ncbi:MAG: hypothetical protein M1826_000380 [Phylliscum demangeonii]|nr:MAG: hypothetical protein M1826_000380 [Phylliscum demangeonii]
MALGLMLRRFGLASSLLLAHYVQAQSTPTASSFRPIFTVPSDVNDDASLLPTSQDPQAPDPQALCPGYKASNLVETASGFTAQLFLAGPTCNVYGNDIVQLALTVEYQARDRLHVGIIPAYLDASNASQYVLSNELVSKPTVDLADSSGRSCELNLSWTNDPTFGFTIARRASGHVLFSTAGKKLVFEEQFLEFGSDLPDNYNLYGLGETIREFRLGNNLTRTIYAADVGDNVDANLYGSHPFYLETRYSETGGSQSHGVYLRNAHGQEVVLRPQNITWRTIGGSIDLYFFPGPSPPDVTRSYQTGAIGLPAMQMYWPLGYHQCRWGYHNWSELQDVVDSFDRFEIPLETIWTDIDIWNQYRDFENDPNTFPYDQGRQFLQKLHDSGRHFTPIVDAAIYIPNPDNSSDAYEPFTAGNQSNAFLKNPDGSLYVGAVWPGYTVFPDWHAPGAGAWWTDQMVRYHERIPFDGIWIDMNEASSFCVGSCGSKNLSLNPVHPPFSLPGEPGNINFEYPEDFARTNATEAAAASSSSARQAAAAATPGGNSSSSPPPSRVSYLRTTATPGARDILHPPYVINNAQGGLGVHAVSPNATHADGVVEYDVHNLFGHQILNATYQALVSVFPGKRPFILGRSTFAGSGKYAAHWGGDNYSKWCYMYLSIPQALSFSLYGIPMVSRTDPSLISGTRSGLTRRQFGVDICGFSGNADLELCILAANPQEPYVWASVAEASKRALAIRYTLLPYLYTLLHDAHTTGSTVLRALAWEFPDDSRLAAADRQFLLGPAILVTPVLTAGATTVDGVFPGLVEGDVAWYDWYEQTAVAVPATPNVTIDAPLGHIPVFVRGGYVLPTQEPGRTTRDCRRNPWGLLVALDLDGRAEGALYVDDGESLVPQETIVVKFSAQDQRLRASVSHCAYNDTNPLGSITIMGAVVWPPPPASVTQVSLNGLVLAPDSSWSYNATSNVLRVAGPQIKDWTRSRGGAWKGGDWELAWC